MYRKCFFKNKGVLSRRFVASGLAAVFSAGMFGSYAGAMDQESNVISVFDNKDQAALDNFLENNPIEDNDENAREVINLFYSLSELPAKRLMEVKWKDKCDNKLLEDRDFLTRVYAYLLLYRIASDKIIILDFKNFLEGMKSDDAKPLKQYFTTVFFYLSDADVLTKFLNKIEEGWGNDLLKEVKEDKQKKLENVSSNNESINIDELDKNIKKKKIVVSVVIILLAIIVTITLALKGKSNTGVPNNNKDDEKVNPSIEPEKDKDDEKMNPSTDPESDEQNPEQKKQEQGSQEQKSSIGLKILKGAGATTVTAGTLAGGTYLFNKVLKSGKPSEVKISRNVDNKYMYLDSDGNKVTKTEESEKTHDNYDTDGESADNSGTKQLLEDKNAEEKEEGQEKILERSALSNDTEATSDEDKNKD